jgi:hypothetical protein
MSKYYPTMRWRSKSIRSEGDNPISYSLSMVADASRAGGMAGQALHPLSLGNVATLRRLLDEHEETREAEWSAWWKRVSHREPQSIT